MSAELEEVFSVESTISMTEVDTVQFSYKWTINNFLTSCGPCESLSSQIFSPIYADKLKWSMEIFPFGEETESENSVLYLKLVSSDKSEVITRLAFHILNSKGKTAFSYDEKALFKFSIDKTPGYKIYIKRSSFLDKSKGISPEKFSILCDVNICTVRDGETNATQHQLLRDFSRLFDNQKLYDVKIKVSGRELVAHKAILGARSPVFLEKFESDSKEDQLNQVDINDIDSEAINEMLRYIYTGKVNNMASVADRLLVAAHKYQLDLLKTWCEEELRFNGLVIENAANILILADRHCCEKLKTAAIEFIQMHTVEVMKTAGFKNILDLHPHLTAEILLSLAAQKK